MKYDVIIIGAGASGMVCAIEAAKRNKKVLILEKNTKVGKKIYATGNGKCNFSNDFMDMNVFRGDKIPLIAPFFNEFEAKVIVEYLKNLGIYPKNKNGYWYPKTEQASTVAEILSFWMKKYGVHVLCEHKVKEVTKEKKEFQVQTENGSFQAQKVVLATGGMASPQLGTCGEGYAFAKALGHSIVEPVQGLVPLLTVGKNREIAGVRMWAKVKLAVGKEERYTQEGEILFSEQGISGIPVMQLSRYVSRAGSRNEKIQMELDLAPDMDMDTLTNWINEGKQRSKSQDRYEWVFGILPNKLSGLLAAKNKNATQKELANQIKHYKVDIKGTKGFEDAQVTAGGVDLEEVHLPTLESKICKGLYLTGELVDVDGTCGGYNLQWAFGTGILAGRTL